MSNKIQLYKGDIPENLELSNLLAIDCEFMGLLVLLNGSVFIPGNK